MSDDPIFLTMTPGEIQAHIEGLEDELKYYEKQKDSLYDSMEDVDAEIADISEEISLARDHLENLLDSMP